MAFDTESGYDYLSMNGVDYSGNITNGPAGVTVNTGTFITWRSDRNVERAGFEICGVRVAAGITFVQDVLRFPPRAHVGHCATQCTYFHRYVVVTQYSTLQRIVAVACSRIARLTALALAALSIFSTKSNTIYESIKLLILLYLRKPVWYPAV
eukprot:5377773-Pyramimonas_sp.AAC.3